MLIALYCLIFLLEKGINKLFGVKKKQVSETSGKKVDQWGRRIILMLFLCTIPIYSFYTISETTFIKWYWIFYLTALLGFQSMMEWKYLKNSKQYLTTLILLVLGILFLYNLDYFIRLLG
ncbi:DUF4181 domain-containing protein [Niallia circulans]|uniref:DUF4181 domain-containing protein n=1 Tax=Niallia circulans TaxID=1397 RepID=A0A553SUL1_NIACI|nr:DUF4181 domain-containing protein [Niallia circulans]TRZ40681.1 DUF4181 domain-containing protein [Niallia circulans]